MKKKLQHSCFPVNIAKFLRTPILKNICERLLLDLSYLSNTFQRHFLLHFWIRFGIFCLKLFYLAPCIITKLHAFLNFPFKTRWDFFSDVNKCQFLNNQNRKPVIKLNFRTFLYVAKAKNSNQGWVLNSPGGSL